MDGRDLTDGIDPEAGAKMHALIAELYPVCRSITGDGVRTTLRQIGRHVPLTVHEVPSGTPVFDWTVPLEWNIREAYVKDPGGRRIIDFAKSSLHVLNYSVPVHRTMPLAELREHLHSLPEHPDWIPYKTSYYKADWGFCLPHAQRVALEEGSYEVCIDSSLVEGHLSYGECFLPGASPQEVLISCHVCHPSLCNDNLSGVALATFLARHLLSRPLRYSYRFLFAPGTIGAITWLARNEEATQRIAHGLVVACVGDRGQLTYKRSRRGNAEIDQAVVHVLRHSGQPYGVIDFSPEGYDERQFCSPGFNLPVGSLTRTPHGQYPEYHTSADDLTYVDPASLADSLAKYLAVLRVLEDNRICVNQNPKCEPQLGRRGLYRALGGHTRKDDLELALLWVLNQSDGTCSLLDIAERADLPFDLIAGAAGLLRESGLLKDSA